MFDQPLTIQIIQGILSFCDTMEKILTVINDKKEPEIKEIYEKKLIDIRYELINNNNDIENSMTDVDEDDEVDSNLSNSEDNEED